MVVGVVVNKRLIPTIVTLIVHSKKYKVFTYDTSKELVSKPGALASGLSGVMK